MLFQLSHGLPAGAVLPNGEKDAVIEKDLLRRALLGGGQLVGRIQTIPGRPQKPGQFLKGPVQMQ